MTSYTNVTTTYPEGSSIPIKRVRKDGPPPATLTSAQAKNFILGDEWQDITGGDIWKLAAIPTGGVQWVRIGGTGGTDIAQITPDSGAPVIGIAQNIFSTGFPVGTTNLKGIKTFNGGGAGDVLEFQNLRDLSRYIVGTNANESQFTSIQTAINTAVADGFNTANPTVVYILPGTYVENLTLQPGIALAGLGVNAESSTVLIQGAAVLNPGAGTNSFSAAGVTFATNGAANPAFSIQGANGISVFFNDCAFIGNSGTAYETLNASAVPKHSSCFYSAAAGQKCLNLLGGEDLFINCMSSFTDTKSVVGQKCSFFDSTFNDSFTCTNAGNPLFFNCLITSTKFPATNFEAISIAATGQVGLIDCFMDTNSPTGFSVTGTGSLGYNLITTGQPFDPALSTFGFTTFTGNLSFDGGANTIASDGQLIIGDTGSFPKINTLTAGAGIAITNGAGTITIALSGGGTAIDSVNVDASTAPGTNPVVPTGAGAITVTGGQVAAGTIGANAIRTNSLAANTYTVQIQRSGSSGASSVNNAGICSFNNADFSVDANGYVALANAYSSGSWTPTIFGATVAGVTTYVTQNGTYILIGNLVLASAVIQISAATGTGDLQIGGFPFTISNGASASTQWGGTWAWPAGTTCLNIEGVTGAAFCKVKCYADGVGTQNMQMQNLSLTLDFSLTYIRT